MRDKIIRFFRYLVLRERSSYDIDVSTKARIYEGSMYFGTTEPKTAEEWKAAGGRPEHK